MTLPAQPDTGPVRTASVGGTDVACGAALGVVVLPVPVDPHSTVTLPGGATLVVNEQHAADGDRVLAVAVVEFRGLTYRYRRQVWPPAHPVATAVSIYATMIEERLLTRRPPAGAEPGDVIDI